MADFFEKNLKDDEVIIEVVRRFYLTFFLPGGLAIFFILLAFFFLFPLLAQGLVGKIIFCVLLLTGMILLARVIAMHYFNCLIVTNQRIIDYDQKGLFERHVSEARYDKIQDVSFKQKGVWQVIFNYGTLEIQTAGAGQKLEAQKVRNPQKLQQLIMDVQQEYKNK